MKAKRFSKGQNHKLQSKHSGSYTLVEASKNHAYIIEQHGRHSWKAESRLKASTTADNSTGWAPSLDNWKTRHRGTQFPEFHGWKDGCRSCLTREKGGQPLLRPLNHVVPPRLSDFATSVEFDQSLSILAINVRSTPYSELNNNDKIHHKTKLVSYFYSLPLTPAVTCVLLFRL